MSDILNSINTTSQITTGSSFIGEIENSNDRDWIKVELTQNFLYNINLKGSISNLGTLRDTYIYGIYDSNGNYISNTSNDDTNGLESFVEFTALVTDTYYISVGAYGTDTGSYTLDIDTGVEVVPDILSSIDTQGEIQIGQTISDGDLKENYDHDWFKLVIGEGDLNKKYTIQANSDTSYTSLDIRDAQGSIIYSNTIVENNSISGVDSTKIFTPSTVGTYFLDVGGYYNKSSFSLSIDDGEAIIPDILNNTSTSAILEIGQTILDGQINNHYDNDWFKLVIGADDINKKYTIQANSDNSYVSLYIKDSNGNTLYSDNGVSEEYTSGVDSTKTFTATTAGTYYVSVNGGYTLADYSLSIDSGVAVIPDVVESVNTSATINLGSIYSGDINIAYDKDWIKVELSANKEYKIELKGQDSNLGTLRDTYIYGIYDSNGNIIENTSNDDTNGLESQILFTAQNDSVYYISVGGFSSSTGTYTLSIDNGVTAVPDTGSSITNYGTFDQLDLDGNGEITSTLGNGYDNDWFKISVDAGKSYDISLDSNMNYPYLNILDKNGNYVWQGINYDYSSQDNSSIIFTASTDNDYFIQVSGWEEGEYKLSFKENTTITQDNIGNDITNHAVFSTLDTDSNGEIEGRIDSSYDSDWYEIDVTQGTRYEISLESTNNTYPYLSILNNHGNLVWDGISYDYSAQNDSTIIFTPSQSGIFFVEVNGWQIDDFTLKIQNQTIEDDFSADINTTGILTLGEQLNAEIESNNDKDWFKIHLNEGIYKINLNDDSSDNIDIDTIIDGVYDSNGNYISSTYNDDGGDGFNSELIFNVNSSGDYYISASAFNLGKYNITVSNLTNQNTNEIADDLTTTANITVDSDSYNGEIDFAFDDDYVKVSLVENTTYVIDLKGNSLNDTYINGIYNDKNEFQNGTSNDDASWHTLDSQVTFTASESSDYYISVGAFSNHTGTYELEIKTQNTSTNNNSNIDEVNNNDSNNTINTAISNNALDTYIDGIIDYSGDDDYYAFNLEAGKSYEVNILGSDTNSGTLGDAYLNGVYDSNGLLINNTSNDDGGIGLNSQSTFTASQDGTYYVSASGLANSIGTYQIKVSEDVEVQTVDTISDVNSNYNAGDESWTIMVYLAADNNLEAMALDDINEMELANLPDNVNVTFLIDRADGYSSSDGDWTDTRQGIIQHDTDAYSISSSMQSLGEQNTGDGQTLTNFINWSQDTATADNYGLVIWDHGGGISGVAWDGTSGNDNLGIQELTQAVKNSDIQNFDMIGFDTCLQGVLDQTYDLRDVTDVVVASEDLEPGDGWDYTGWFNSLSSSTNASSSEGSTITTTELATNAVTSFGDFYSGGYSNTTLSAVYTDKIDEVVTAFGDLNQSLGTISVNQNTSIDRQFNNITKFGSYEEYLDLGDLANVIDSINITNNVDANGKTTDNYAQALTSAINDAVFANASTVNDASGISIYYPGYQDQNYIEDFSIAEETHITQLYDVLS